MRAGERARFRLEFAGKAEEREVVGFGAALDEDSVARLTTKFASHPLPRRIEFRRGFHSFRVNSAGISDYLCRAHHLARGQWVKRSRARVIKIDAGRTEECHFRSVHANSQFSI